MKASGSPWVYQLDSNRPIKRLDSDIKTDVVVIGAGIAGISTAFFILRDTDRKVVMLEKKRLASGASGHNAGQVTSYFERPFFELQQEFGLDKATDAQRSIEGAWELLNLMYTEAGLTIPFSRFMGYAGLSSEDQVLHFLRESMYRSKGGLPLEPMWISLSVSFLERIPKEYKPFYKVVPQSYISDRLESKDESLIAVISSPKGCVNSALFCQEVVKYLLQKYPNRFVLYEEAGVNKVVLHEDKIILDAENHTVETEKVVLCTNGFEHVTIINNAGLEVNTKFHQNVSGRVGYMSGYLEKYDKPPVAISYFTDPDATAEDPYFYLTRRQYEYDGKKDMNLICIGGPDQVLPDKRDYISDFEYPEEAQEKIDQFVKKVYDPSPNRKIDYKFTWHGLMGYTKNGVRLIGEEPKNRNLLYNLGCNGIGILPSVFGASRIAKILRVRRAEKLALEKKPLGKASKNEKVEPVEKIEPMIFDPK